MKQLILILCMCTVLGLITGSQSPAQTPKIGYVNSAKVLQEFPEAQEAQRKLDAMGKQWQGQLEQMEKDLQARYDDFQKKEPLLKDDEKRSQREELLALQQKGLQFRQAGAGQTLFRAE